MPAPLSLAIIQKLADWEHALDAFQRTDDGRLVRSLSLEVAVPLQGKRPTSTLATVARKGESAHEKMRAKAAAHAAIQALEPHGSDLASALFAAFPCIGPPSDGLCLTWAFKGGRQPLVTLRVHRAEAALLDAPLAVALPLFAFHLRSFGPPPTGNKDQQKRHARRLKETLEAVAKMLDAPKLPCEEPSAWIKQLMDYDG